MDTAGTALWTYPAFASSEQWRDYFMSERQQTLMKLAQLDRLLGLPPTVEPKHKRQEKN